MTLCTGIVQPMGDNLMPTDECSVKRISSTSVRFGRRESTRSTFPLQRVDAMRFIRSEAVLSNRSHGLIQNTLLYNSEDFPKERRLCL